MNYFNIPNEKKSRVIINTDAKNEVDDQFAICHALLTESFDLRGIIAAHFGDKKSSSSMEDSYSEIQKVINLMNNDYNMIYKGAPHQMNDEFTPVVSSGADLIISEAMKDDDRPLYIAFLGPLTDMASALLLKPEIAEKNIIVVWIGGGDYPSGCREYNLSNDINAANVIMKSKLNLWQIPRHVYRMMPMSYAELYISVRPYGEIGKYLCDNVIDFNNEDQKRPKEYRVIGDSPAIGVIMYEDAGEWETIQAHEFTSDMHYGKLLDKRLIRVYKNINSRFIFSDFIAKLKLQYSE